MANKNDYNYYKNEYGKYKESYYSPGSEEYKKRQSSSRKQKVARFFRAFFVFLIIAAIVVGAVLGIMKLSETIKNRSQEETTVSTTKAEETTKNDSKFKAGVMCKVKTKDGTGVNLRNEPTYDVGGFKLLNDGTEIEIAEVSKDGEWVKTANLNSNGWVNVKYLEIVEKETEKETTEKPTEAESTTKKPVEETTEGATKPDGSIKTYEDAVKAFKDKGNGAVMNCKVVCKGSCFAKANADANSANILYLINGQSVKVTAVSGDFSQIITTINGTEYKGQWVSNENLSFVSWG